MITAFPGICDVAQIYRLLKCRSERFFPQVQYRSLYCSDASFDGVHNELHEEDKKFKEPISLYGFLKPDPEKHPHTEFGIERVRNVVLEVTVPHMLDAELLEQDPTTLVVTKRIAKAGDRFTWSTMIYDVLEVALAATWANTDIPLYFAIRAERFRPEALEYMQKGRSDLTDW